MMSCHSYRFCLLLSLYLLFLPCTPAPLFSQENQEINTEKPGVYMGRQIAWTMHVIHANWLLRNVREKQESVQEMIDNLGLKPGMTVADVGCGNGYHALMMAKLVGDKGKILCVDVQKKMLEILEMRAKEQGISNYETILGEFEDPKLPKGIVDLILIVDAYHEFTKPAQMLAKMRESLAPGGQLVLLEFRGEDKAVPIRPDHKMTKKQILKELNANGYVLSKSYDKLPWQHMLFFKVKKR